MEDKMTFEIVYRYFPCDGLCGTYLKIPTKIARSIMKSNGTILPHEEVLCLSCQNWVAWEIDYAQQICLPRPT